MIANVKLLYHVFSDAKFDNSVAFELSSSVGDADLL